MDARHPIRPSIRAVSIALLVGVLLVVNTRPAALFTLSLWLAAAEDFDTGDVNARVQVFEALERRARSARGLDGARERGWTCVEHDGLVLETFYDGFEIRWYVSASDTGELLGHSGVVFG